MHEAGTSALSALDIQLRVEGTPPSRGFIVANHLSYLDIALFSAACPCFFVSKAEVARWPLFGFLAGVGGTLFVDRGSRSSAANVVREMGERFQHSIPVLVFPEGTSTDGSTVLRFHSTLFEPAVRAEAIVTPAAVRYRAAKNRNERDLCWFGDAAFLPHLWQTLKAESFEGIVRFGSSHVASDRRQAAIVAHAEVVALRRMDK